MAAIPMVAVATAPVPKTGPASSSTECLIPHRLGSRWTTSWTDPAGFDRDTDEKESLSMSNVSVRVWGRGKKPKPTAQTIDDGHSSGEDTRRWTSPASAPSPSDKRNTFGEVQTQKKKRYSFMPARVAPAPPPEAPDAESAEAAHASALAKLTGSPPAATEKNEKKHLFSRKSLPARLPARPPSPEALPPTPLLSLKDVGGMSFASANARWGEGQYDAFGAVIPKPRGDTTPPKANPFDGGFAPVSPHLGEERRAKRLSRHATGERPQPPPLPAPADMLAASPTPKAERAARHYSAPVGRPVKRTLRRKPAPKADEELLQSESGHSGHTTPDGPGAAPAASATAVRPGVGPATAISVVHTSEPAITVNGAVPPAAHGAAGPALAGAGAAAALGAAAFARPVSSTPWAGNLSPAALGAAERRCSDPALAVLTPNPPRTSSAGEAADAGAAAPAVETPREGSAPTAAPAMLAPAAEAATPRDSAATDVTPTTALQSTQPTPNVSADIARTVSKPQPPAAETETPSSAATSESTPTKAETPTATVQAGTQSPAKAQTPQSHARHSSGSTTASMHTSLSDSTTPAVTAPTSPLDAEFPAPSAAQVPRTPQAAAATAQPAFPIVPVVPVTSMPPRSSTDSLASPTVRAFQTADDVATPLAEVLTTPRVDAGITTPCAPQSPAVQDSELLPANTQAITPAPTTVAAHVALASAVDAPLRKALAISPPRRAPIPAAWQSQQSLLVPEDERPSSTTPPATAESGIFPQHREEFVDAREGFGPPTSTQVPAAAGAAAVGMVAAVGAAIAHSHSASSSMSSMDSRLRMRPADIAHIPPYSPPRRAVAPVPSEYAYDRPAAHAGAAESLRARHGLSPEPPEEARHLRVSAYGVPELDFTRTPPPERDEEAETEAEARRSSSEREILRTPALSDNAPSVTTYSESQYIQAPWPRSRGDSRASSGSRSTTSAATSAGAAPPSVSAFTDRLPRRGYEDDDGVEGLISAQHTGTTKGQNDTADSSRAPSWIDHARPPKVLELEAAVAATIQFPNSGEEQMQKEGEREPYYGHAETASGSGSVPRTRTISRFYAGGSRPQLPPTLQPVFHAPPPPLYSPSATAPPPRDHFGTYPAGHTYAAPFSNHASGSIDRASRPHTADTMGASRPHTVDTIRSFGSLGRSSRSANGGIASSHPFNALRTALPSPDDTAPLASRPHSRPGTAESGRRARASSTSPPGERATSPTPRATSPLNAAQLAKPQPISAAHASALSRLEGSAETYSLAHEAHPRPPPSFPGARTMSPEPRRRFSFRTTTSGGSTRDKKKKRFSLLPEILPEKNGPALEISAPVPASEAPLPADAWPTGGVDSRLNGIAQTPLPPAPAVSALAVGTPVKLSIHPDSARNYPDVVEMERPASVASRRSRRWSFKPGKRRPDTDVPPVPLVPPVPALPPVLPLPNFGEAKDVSQSDSQPRPTVPRATSAQLSAEMDDKRRKGGKFMRTLRGLFGTKL
ncbi:hypothetical protein CspeluHIS016_0100160 [Cutaneotrichosporon spelunceum]|uniref:Uncharacterized protein n=1 Tax=Cutaneotrichosporon spelunceum TaxID=1672016 RepID=A0AAD3TMI2_9TREE|nr:hypothetical protein CspeluHIS016_0100160 [Cutaneotrichosporon spelunceum]